ncbi:hypothetical protein FHX42_003415 [Saccharopolyspora lacisalsi]|uniref:Uncharacterized protein n=1 Tax=Halosaccharopolyspora lacisalsi TaxID=1000566 RepID=A0A839DZB6_9PSEU|nr:hypothetical protein [Halosaccharopolyspora lacisalsi]
MSSGHEGLSSRGAARISRWPATASDLERFDTYLGLEQGASVIESCDALVLNGRRGSWLVREHPCMIKVGGQGT